MSRRKVQDRERKAREKKKAEAKKRTPDGILIFLVICLAIGGLIYTEKDPLVGLAVFMSAGILMIPNAILKLRKDSKVKKYNRTVNDLIRCGDLTKIEDDTPYRKKIIWGVFREGFLNVAAFMLMYGFAVTMYYLKGNYALMSRDRGVGMFCLVIAILLFSPLLAYSGGFTIARLICAIRRDYIVCRGTIARASGMDEKLYIKCNPVNFKFDYCRGVGVNPKTLTNKEAVIVFCHDEIYVMECEE
ncbi:hypothetical protein SAMN06296952_2094 [Oscillospiraceae bacterium]|nr:hypothetical protein SAMN06296952_2094 [Oscillospiraceae bacterium]